MVYIPSTQQGSTKRNNKNIQKPRRADQNLKNCTLQVVLFCPEWQEETPKTPQGVSPTIVNEGNEAGRKMWGQGEISRTKVVQSDSCRGNRWTHTFRTRLKKENSWIASFLWFRNLKKPRLLQITPFQELHPWTLTWNLKIPIFNRKYSLKWWMFHCHVSFRGCNYLVGRVNVLAKCFFHQDFTERKKDFPHLTTIWGGVGSWGREVLWPDWRVTPPSGGFHVSPLIKMNKFNLRLKNLTHRAPLEGTPRPFTNKSVWECLCLWRWKGKSGVSSWGMWAKSLIDLIDGIG